MDTTTEAKMETAQIIRDQIGTGTLAMLGAHSLVGSEDSLMFGIKGSSKGNKVRIVLDPTDTYTVELWKVRGVDFNKVASFSDVYADSLHKTIESLTGLYTRL